MGVVMDAKSLDVSELFEQIIDNDSLTGDLWIDQGFCEELEYFDHEPEYVENVENSEYVAMFDFDTVLWFHEAGGMDVDIGIQNTVRQRDGESQEIDEGSLMVKFEVDEDGEIHNADGYVEIEAPDINQVSHEEPAEFHDTPYKVV
jgi:hypothetical protein